MKKLLLSLVLLASCAPGVARLERSAISNASVFSDFAPDKGQGASYKVGQQLKLTFKLARSGFVTLLSVGSDDETTTVENSISMLSGARVLPRVDDRSATGGVAAYIADPPVGRTRAVLIYADVPSNGLKIRGKYDNQQLEAAIKQHLKLIGAKTTDVVETQFEVTP